MRFRNAITLSLVVAFFAGTSAAHANSYFSINQGARVLERCNKDPLDNIQAEGRVHWYAKCHPDLLRADMEAIEGAPPPDFLSSYYDFMGFKLNAEGKWVRKAERVFYPLFERAELDAWHAPTQITEGTSPEQDVFCRIQIPEGYKFSLSCRSSCYTPSMRLEFPEGALAIKAAFDARTPKTIVLAEDSTLEEIKTASIDVFGYVVSRVEQEHDILTFETASGGRLEVTTNHPLLDAAGYVREAGTFGVGDALIRADSSPDEIVNITPWKYYGKVYNIAPDSVTKLGNVVIAEGFLSGSELFQNEWKTMLDSQLLRANIPAEALE